MAYRLSEATIGWDLLLSVTFLVAMYMKNSPYKNVDNKTIPNLYKEVFSYSLPLTGAFIAGFFCNSADQFLLAAIMVHRHLPSFPAVVLASL